MSSAALIEHLAGEYAKAVVSRDVVGEKRALATLQRAAPFPSGALWRQIRDEAIFKVAVWIQAQADAPLAANLIAQIIEHYDARSIESDAVQEFFDRLGSSQRRELRRRVDEIVQLKPDNQKIALPGYDHIRDKILNGRII